MKAERTRAGCWRRLLSLLLDSALVYIPFQIIALVLFALTAGMVQFTSGLSATS